MITLYKHCDDCLFNGLAFNRFPCKKCNGGSRYRPRTRKAAAAEILRLQTRANSFLERVKILKKLTKELK